METDHSFSEKALMLSCIQKTEQPAKGFYHRGCKGCDGAERKGISFALPVLFSNVFSHACKDKKTKTMFTLIPNTQSYSGGRVQFSAA